MSNMSTQDEDELREQLVDIVTGLNDSIAKQPKTRRNRIEMEVGNLMYLITSYSQSIKEQAEREGRINSIQLYMDSCEENGVDPSWETIHEFQDGQRAAYKALHSTNNSLEEK